MALAASTVLVVASTDLAANTDPVAQAATTAVVPLVTAAASTSKALCPSDRKS
jgi:hypothetical protein